MDPRESGWLSTGKTPTRGAAWPVHQISKSVALVRTHHLTSTSHWIGERRRGKGEREKGRTSRVGVEREDDELDGGHGAGLVHRELRGVLLLESGRQRVRLARDVALGLLDQLGRTLRDGLQGQEGHARGGERDGSPHAAAEYLLREFPTWRKGEGREGKTWNSLGFSELGLQLRCGEGVTGHDAVTLLHL